MPRVSVLIASYNSEAYIQETLDSVLGQTYADWEVIVADDASTDGTVDVVRGFGERVRLLESSVNAGQPAAGRARALAVATGELVTFLDGDDAWTPDFLAEMVGTFDRERARTPDVGVVACDAHLLLPGGGRADRTYAEAAGMPDELGLDQLLRFNPIYTSALSPRAVLQEAGGIAEDLTGTDDHDLWIRVLELGYRAVWVPRPLAIYRVRSSSLSQDLAAMARQTQEVYRRAIARGRLSGRQLRYARRRLRIHRAVERFEELAAARRAGRMPIAATLRSLPLFTRVAVENPGSVAAGLRRAAGGRHRPFAGVAPGA